MTLLYKLLGVGALLIAMAYGFIQYRDSERTYSAGIERALWEGKLTTQKREAQTVLETEQKALAVASGQLATAIKSLETQREKLQADNVASLRKYAADNYRLRYKPEAGDGGGRGGGVVTTTGKAGTAIDASASFVQLPDKINGNLFALAGDAQSLLIDYRVLYAYVHDPKLVCSLRKDK